MDTLPIGIFFFITALIMLLLPQTRERKLSSILFSVMLSIGMTGIFFIILDVSQIFPTISFIFWKDWITAYQNAWNMAIAIMILLAFVITAAAYYKKSNRREITAFGILTMLMWGIFVLYPLLGGEI